MQFLNVAGVVLREVRRVNRNRYLQLSACVWGLVLGFISMGSLDARADLPAPPAALKNTCFSCHGQNNQAYGSFNLNDSVETMISKGVIVPGSPSTSLIFEKISKGLMPPDQSKKLSANDQTAVSAWIQSIPASQPTGLSLDALTNAQAIQKIEDFRATLNDFDRGYQRFFSLVELKNQGLSDDDLEIYHQALIRAINTLSWKEKLIVPAAVGGSGLLWSVNIKDLGWAPDFWQRQFGGFCPQLIQDSNANAGRDWSAYVRVVNDGGAQIDNPAFLSAHEGTFFADIDLKTRPLFFDLPSAQEISDCVTVPLDYFVGQVTNQDVYREILLANPDQTISTINAFASEFLTEGDFQILPTDEVTAMALAESGVSLNNREIWRDPDPSLNAQYFWHSGDFKSGIGPRDLAEHPEAHPDAGEFIVSLPNGYQAYFIAANTSQLLEQADTSIVVDASRVDSKVTAPSSCLACHGNLGLIPRAANEAINATDPAIAGLVAFFPKDNARYAAALKNTGTLRTDSLEPVTYMRRKLMSGVYR